MDNTTLPRTKAERDALFAKLFVGIQPADAKPTSIAATLRPYRSQLLAKRREGYSLRQIAEQLKGAPLCCNMAPSTLKEIIAGPAAKRRAKIKKLEALRAANMAAAKAAAGGKPGGAPIHA